uniref:MutS family DNA mismatch repair protein n=1 Tax=uncultured Flavobacteriia bacterium TaxID=212695 RepID=H6RDV2_9BACT|nr:MutS-related protein, family 1 [uncultured bacterium]CCF99213.1 MutS family DNA mismatch repair protein [uncultured Flavobacteriia bacterium]
MSDPVAHYTKNIKDYKTQLAAVRKKLLTSSSIRLVLFLTACAGIYFAWGNTQIILAIIVVFIIIFLFLVSKHSDLQYKRDFLEELIKINTTEIKVLHRDFHDLPDGDKFKNGQHAFSMDIDLFGRGSFFQYLNRTRLDPGAEKLANIFTENSIANIPQKQEAIQELSAKSAWRQTFSATAALVKTEVPVTFILKWLKAYKPYVPQTMRYIPQVFSLISLVVFVLYYFDILPIMVLVSWFFVGLAISGAFIKKTNKLAEYTSKTQTTFDQYYKLLIQLENEEFTSALLREKMANIAPENGKKASEIVKILSKRLSAFDQRGNLLVGTFTNAFMLSDLRHGYAIEKWIANHAEQISDWFEVIAFFDAYNSLGNFSFNHTHYTFPEIKTDAKILESTAASHPLLDSKKAVSNDFSIDEEQFFIITGANMAGKSTFLRTVSLQIVMANVGLPVCAASASYTPIKLITSMRTTDSLTDDASYFFSELKRLQFIVKAIQTDRYFIILDEILKGTNSTDKAIGSRKFIDKLVASHSTGIIATHDLSLCAAADELPPVENYYFDAEIKNDELFFDYTFKKGICQNMNASFLLRKMNIIDA